MYQQSWTKSVKNFTVSIPQGPHDCSPLPTLVNVVQLEAEMIQSDFSIVFYGKGGGEYRYL